MNISWFKIFIFFLIFFYQAAFCQALIQPKLVIENREYLVNNEIDISVTGLLPNQKFTLRTTTYDQRERPWIASATFQSDDEGNADIKNIEPINGTYSGKDAMGIFWSARFNGIPLDSATRKGIFARRSSLKYNTLIELLLDDIKVDSANIYRSFLSKNVKADTLNYEMLEGIIYRPLEPKVDGVVIVLSGSDGGLASADWRAALLSSNGIPALALAYFNYGGLPEDLIEIPLEYISETIDYLKKALKYEKIGILGFSKGSELALTYSSKVPINEVDVIVAISPSSYIWQGINRNVDVKSSWSLKGEPLKFIPWQYNQEIINMLRDEGPKKFRALYQFSLESENNQENVKNASLNLNASRASVLLIAGTDDCSWPADIMVNQLIKRLDAGGYSSEYKAIIFKDAGHLIFFDFLPVTDSYKRGGQIFGGTFEANIEARKDAWKEVEQFFLKALGD